MGAPLPSTSAIDWVCSTQRGRAREGTKVRAPMPMHSCNHTDSESHPTVKVKVCHAHCAHEPRLGHIRLSKEVTLKIAGRLVQGIVYDNFR